MIEIHTSRILVGDATGCLAEGENRPRKEKGETKSPISALRVCVSEPLSVTWFMPQADIDTALTVFIGMTSGLCQANLIRHTFSLLLKILLFISCISNKLRETLI